MKNKFIIIFIISCLLVTVSSYARTSTRNAPGTFVQEEDGDPAARFRRLKFANGTLTNNGDGSVSISGGGGGTIDGSGTSNFITKWLDSDTLTDSVMFDDGTNVGIGTTNPAEMLTINGGKILVNSSLNIVGDSTFNQSFIAPEDAGGNQVIITNDANSTSDHDQTTRTNPSLYIYSDLDPDLSNNEWGSFAHDEEDFIISTGVNVGLGTSARTVDNAIRFNPRGGTKMIVKGNGNVGIGTTDPDELLHIFDGADAELGMLISADNGNDTTLDLMEGSAGSGADDAEFGVLGNGVRFIHDGGDNKLYVQSGVGVTVTDRVTLERTTGNVGIGTTGPTELLDVAGSIAVSGTVDGVDIADAASATYVTLSTNTTLANERVLTAGEGIDITDAGAGSTITVSGEDASDSNKGIATFNARDFVATSGDITSTKGDYFNGTFSESFDAKVIERAGAVIMTLEQAGTGDLTEQFSSGNSTLDCTGLGTTSTICEATLTAGSDSSPQGNWVYILQSSPSTITVSTSAWPSSEHIKIGFFFVQSAANVSTDGGSIVNQNWNDHLQNSNNIGHLAHIVKKVRTGIGATYFSGIDGNGATASYYTISASNTEFISTSGIIMQMHDQTFPAFNTSTGSIMHVVNSSVSAFRSITDLFSITTDSTGATITNNKFFNLITWGVINKTGEHQTVMVNVPDGFYNSQSNAENDVSGFDVFTIPREFGIDSSTGFLIARTTFQMGTTWTHVSTVDLRGTKPQTASGGAAGVATDFADSTFTIFDNTDNTKILNFDVGTNVTTANTRTLNVPDASGNIALTSQTDGTLVDADIPNDITIDLATLASTLTITDNEATAETNAILFTSGGSLGGGNLGIESDGDLTYTPNTGNLSATLHGGIAEGNLVDKSAGEVITADWDFGDGGIEVENSTTVPGSCTVGQLFMDTDATSGQQIYGCEAGSFVQQAGGGGGGAFSDAGDPIVQNTTTKDVQIGDGAGTLTGKIEVGGDADQPQMVIEAFSTQTDDVFIIQNDADTEVFSIGVTGALTNIEGALTDDTLVEGDLKSVNAPTDEYCLTYESTTGDFEWQVCSSGADTNAFKLYSWAAPSTIGTIPDGDATYDGIAPIGQDDGTTLDIWTSSFDDTGDECRGTQFIVPSDVDTGGTATFGTTWYSKTATTGNVAWNVAWHEVNEGESWDAAVTVDFATTDAVQGTVDLVTETTWTETLANLGWTANETVLMWFCRDGDGTNATDSLVGDAEVITLFLELPRD